MNALGKCLRRMHTERKLKELGYNLPPLSAPKGNYRSAVRTGHYIYTAGHLPMKADGSLMNGKVGKDVSEEEGYEAAHLAALSLISTLKGTLLILYKRLSFL